MEGETSVLNRTEFTQPALFVINILYYLESLEKHGTNTEIFVGHSLGEYCAQFIISGDKSELSQFKEKVLNVKGIYHPLQVNGAFHSKRMASIAEEFKGFLEHVDIFPLKAFVLSNVTADFYPLNNREQLIDLLVKQLSYPVRWQQCMEKLHSDKHIIGFEYGPKPVVGLLAKKILGERITLME